MLDDGVLTVEGEKPLREYLSRMERFSVGVHCKVYDISIINSMSGRVLVGQYNSYIRDYIKNRIEQGMEDSTYCEYEKLIKKLVELRAKKAKSTSKSGNILATKNRIANISRIIRITKTL